MNDKMYLDAKRIIDFIEDIKDVWQKHGLMLFAYDDNLLICDLDDVDDYKYLYNADLDCDTKSEKSQINRIINLYYYGKERR